MQTLVSVELTPSEAKEESGATPEQPKYPWGLCIDLNEDTLAKLGIEKLPEVGDTVSIIAKAQVQSVNAYQDQGDKEPRRSMSLQITDMQIDPAAADIIGALYKG